MTPPPKFLGLSRHEGDRYLVISRGLKSGKLDYVPVSRDQILKLIVECANTLRMAP